jgi:hypothetical protein
MSAFSDSYVSRVLLAKPTLVRDLRAAARRWRWLRPHYTRGPGTRNVEKSTRVALGARSYFNEDTSH